jgi:hypothetical protein
MDMLEESASNSVSSSFLPGEALLIFTRRPASFFPASLLWCLAGPNRMPDKMLYIDRMIDKMPDRMSRKKHFAR